MGCDIYVFSLGCLNALTDPNSISQRTRKQNTVERQHKQDIRIRVDRGSNSMNFKLHGHFLNTDVNVESGRSYRAVSSEPAGNILGVRASTFAAMP